MLTLVFFSTWIMIQCIQKDLGNWLHTTRLLVRIIFSFFFIFTCLLQVLALKHLVSQGHYKWALDELFYKHNFDRVIILEGDVFFFWHCFKVLLISLLMAKRKLYWLRIHFWRQMIWKLPLIFLNTLRRHQPFLTRISMSHIWNQAFTFLRVCDLFSYVFTFLLLIVVGQLWLFPHGMTMGKSSLCMIHVSFFFPTNIILFYENNQA